MVLPAVVTLGNFLSKSKRCQSNDPFEKDPFKIQSYNFRYAEKPSFPMPAVKQRVNNNRQSDCQTCFYNYDFPQAKSYFEPRNTALQNEERFLNLNKFQEHRRRKFLHETAIKRNSHLSESNQKPYESKILNFYYGNGNVPTSLGNSSGSEKAKSNYTQNNNPHLNIQRNSSQNNNQKSSHSSLKLSTAKPTSSCQPQLLSSASQNVCAGRSRRSLSSGCVININIKSLEDNSLQDNININIETDSLCKNLNIPLNKYSTGKLQRCNSSDTFAIDKRLSKFSTNPVKPCDIKKSDKERVNELTSIYSSQKLKKFANRNPVKSLERMPTLIPFGRSSSVVKNSSSYAKENSFRRVNTNLGVYDNKANSKGCSYNNNLYRSAYIKNNGETKLLNSPFSKNHNTTPLKSSIYSLSSAANRCDFKPTTPLRLRSSSKLPLNVNINLFADKLKLLKN